MSNYALQSQLSTLETELQKVKDVNRELNRELSTVSNGVYHADNELENLNAHIRDSLSDSANNMYYAHQRIVDSIELQAEVDHLYARFKQVELANKKIRECNNKKYYQFENYRTVRKIVQGIMDNLDVQLVGDEVIAKSIEKQHLQTPDYWLTCVLISIVAWRNDDPELANRAIGKALQLDKKSSAVFYMLFNLRMEREVAALKWFNIYQTCELIGSDQRTFLVLFSMISQTLNNEVDEHTKSEISKFINRVIDANVHSENFSHSSIINSIQHHLKKITSREQIDYPLLTRCCLDYNELCDLMTSAKNNADVLEFILKTTNVPVEQRNHFIKNYIDEMIAEPNTTEKDVYDEIAYNELIIRYEGDIDSAREKFNNEQTWKNNELQLISEMMKWIYESDDEEVNGQIRKNMFILTKSFQSEAIEANVEEYRAVAKTNYSVKIGDYESNVDLNQPEIEDGKISDYYTSVKQNAIGQIKNTGAYICFVLAIASIIGAFYAGFWLFAATVLSVCFGGYILLSNKAKIIKIESDCEKNICNTMSTMNRVFDEFSAFYREFNEYDQIYLKIQDVLSSL